MMNCNSSFIFSESLLSYHFHKEHPFNQKRVALTKDLLKKTHILTNADILEPRMANEDELALFHEPTYIAAVKKAGNGLLSLEEGYTFGLGTEDTPFFPHMHEAASLLVGGTLTAVDAVLNGHSQHALHLGGGLHHGFTSKASGFCIYNDGAIAIKYIRKKLNVKVLYIDTDAHHGDGVQSAFYDDPNVCTVSIHETGRYLFPGSGHMNERGMNDGYGYSFNLPIDAFTEDESFIHVYESALMKIADFFKPDIIITQNGVDAHFYDPLTHLCSTMKTFEMIPLLAHDLAHKYCNGKWIALGGGGYDMWRVVPRAWGQLWSVMKTGGIFNGKLPTTWIDQWQGSAPHPLPISWHDHVDSHPVIPRKAAIEEKNHNMLDAVLKYIKKNENS